MSVIIYYNPACGTSRNTLAMIRQSGIETRFRKRTCFDRF
jgi:arsenate reductase (glutaredoxin)